MISRLFSSTLLLSLLFAQNASALTCREILKREFQATTGIQETDGAIRKTRKIVSMPLKTIFYPVFGTGKVLGKAARVGIWKAPVQTLREDYVLLIAFALLVASQDDKIIQSSKFDELSADFDKNDDDELLVVADIFDPSDIKYGWGEALLKNKYPQFKRKHAIHATSYADLLHQLQEISLKEGPIGRLEINGHGNYGMIDLDPDNAGEGGASGPQAFYRNTVRGVFKADAQVRVSTCLSGSGTAGSELMDALAFSLLDHGGTIYASTRLRYVDDELGYLAHLGRPTAKVLSKTFIGWDSFVNLIHGGRLPPLDYDEPKVKVRHYAPL